MEVSGDDPSECESPAPVPTGDCDARCSVSDTMLNRNTRTGYNGEFAHRLQQNIL